MSRVLRSPASRLLDRGILLLTVFGLRSGRPYTFPVQYVQDGDVLWIFAGAGDEKTWWRNLKGGGPVEVLLRRRVRTGHGEALTPDRDPEAVEEGVRRYIERFPGTAKRLGLPAGDDDAFAEAAVRQTIVRIRLSD